MHIYFLLLALLVAEQSLDMVYYLGSTLFLQHRYDYIQDLFFACIHIYYLNHLLGPRYIDFAILLIAEGCCNWRCGKILILYEY